MYIKRHKPVSNQALLFLALKGLLGGGGARVVFFGQVKSTSSVNFFLQYVHSTYHQRQLDFSKTHSCSHDKLSLNRLWCLPRRAIITLHPI